MSGSERVDGPPPRGRWAQVAAELRAEPGQWMVVETTRDSNAAYCLSHSLRKRHGLTTAVRKVPDGSGWRVYAVALL